MGLRANEAAEKTRNAVEHPAREVRREAETGRGWYGWAARIGLVAKGVSYAIVGILAIAVAPDGSEKATSRPGALATIAQNGWGKALLVALAVGFAAYALWRFVEAFAERADGADSAGKVKQWGKRAGYAGRGLIYAGLTVTTLRILGGADGDRSQNEQARDTTARLLDWPAGRWLVGLVGLAIVGAGLWNAYRGIARTFEDRWRTGEMSAAERRWGSRVGVAGHLARAVVFTLIGLFITRAAVEYDAREAIGLDGALQKLAEASYGPLLLGVTAAGLIAYALYCFLDARYRDVSVNSR
jgi:hypothetical protein